MRLKLPEAQPSQVTVLGKGPEAAGAVVDLLEKLGVTAMTVLVLVETDESGAIEVSRETLTFARGLGDEVHALVVGDGPSGLVDQLGAYGVAAVWHADGDAFVSYGAAAWAAAVVAAADGASVVMAAGTPRGNEVLAHVACRLGVAMAANVVAVDSTDPAGGLPAGAGRGRDGGAAAARRGRRAQRGRPRLRPAAGGRADRAGGHPAGRRGVRGRPAAPGWSGPSRGSPTSPAA